MLGPDSDAVDTSTADALVIDSAGSGGLELNRSVDVENDDTEGC